MIYETLPGSEGSGFNATFHVGTYCPPWEGRCGGAAGGCFTQEQRCDGKWDCAETGKDEEGCRGCSMNQFACGVAGQRMVASGHFPGRPVCYPVNERCNYQLYCADGSDERDCTVCQPGTFHCDSDRSVCDGFFCSVKTCTTYICFIGSRSCANILSSRSIYSLCNCKCNVLIWVPKVS